MTTKTAPRRRSHRLLAATTTATALALVLTACGSSLGGGDGDGDAADLDAGLESAPSTAADPDSATEPGPTQLAGPLPGAGASSMAKAQEGWIAGFTEINPEVQVSYDATGSGNGRRQLIAGGVLFAGTDSVFTAAEVAEAEARCLGGNLLEVPAYISPIAVVYNLPDLDTDHLQLDPETLARIFTGEISRWDDPAIAATNPGLELPGTAITVVNRSDDSGTTENVTDYLHQAAPSVWTYEPSDAWPLTSRQSGDGTSGMIATVSAAEGAIGYADASQVGSLGTVALKVGEAYEPPSAEGAALALDAATPTSDATDLRLTYDLDRTTTAAGAYPVILVSYLAACNTFDSASDAANVKAYLSYVVSVAGQERAAEPTVAGSAPLSDAMRERIDAALATISSS